MKTIQFEADNQLFDDFITWIYKYPKNLFNIQLVHDITNKKESLYIEYVDDVEQKEIDEILKDSECHEISHSKTLSFE